MEQNILIENIDLIVYSWIAIAIISFIALQFVTAPFGRHTTGKDGKTIPNHIGWIIMEFPSLFLVNFFFWKFQSDYNPISVFLVGLWSLHYINRTLIYPLRQKNKNKKIPVSIVGSAIFFNLMNGSLNGYFLATTDYSSGWSYLLFGIGLTMFGIGFLTNIWSDNHLLSLRKPGESKYVIPQKGVFKWISSPNLVFEMVEWIGFALMAQNIAATSFAIWTFANLAPRAIAHHKWYQNKFEDYPKRWALIPWVY